MNYFVAGTDTNVGKTYFSSLLIRTLREAGQDAVGMKPIACGSNEDTGLLLTASGGDVSLSDLNPVHFENPVSPITASELENRSVDVDEILAAYQRLSSHHDSVIVEGVGGWQSPIQPNYTMADLAKSMGSPVIIVVANKLGALNHTLLTLESIERFGLTCAGIVFNHPENLTDIAAQTNRAVLQKITNVPFLCDLQTGQRELPGILARLEAEA
ncbi:MAG: dethiobiotin synthase [Chthoniobacterales bacterium]